MWEFQLPSLHPFCHARVYAALGSRLIYVDRWVEVTMLVNRIWAVEKMYQW